MYWASDEVLLKPVLLLKWSAENWERLKLMLITQNSKYMYQSLFLILGIYFKK